MAGAAELRPPALAESLYGVPPSVASESDSSVELSIILATLNERENLPELIRQLRRLPLPPFEVVVVDDGSTDGTREYLSQVAKEDLRIRPVFHNGAQTLTPAQFQGIAQSRGDFLVVMDSDLQHPPEHVPQLVDELRSGASVVVATRYGPGGAVSDRPAHRALISRGADALAKFALRSARRTTDPMSGFFGFERRVLRSFESGRPGYKFLLSVLAMAGDGRVTEVSYRFAPRNSGKSKITKGPGFVHVFLREVLRAYRLENFSQQVGRNGVMRTRSSSGEGPSPLAGAPMSPDPDAHMAMRTGLAHRSDASIGVSVSIAGSQGPSAPSPDPHVPRLLSATTGKAHPSDTP